MGTNVGPRRSILRRRGCLLQILEVRALWEHYAGVATLPLWGAAAAGDGHSVLVLPGLAAGDASTFILRRFLRSRGFDARGWGQGINLGLRHGVIERLHDTLREMYAESGRKVSLIGWSLGGLYARELAKVAPEMVRLVISMGSPFTGHPRETNAWRIYEFASGHKIDPHSHDLHFPLRFAPPVPTTSIWSRSDGVVSWHCCYESRSHHAENIVVEASHLGLGAHPATLFAVADRLAQPEGEWRPFDRSGWRRLVYGDPSAAPLAPRSARFTPLRARPPLDAAGRAHGAASPAARRGVGRVGSRAVHRKAARSCFLSILPTDVSGNSFTNITCSGMAIREMTPRST